MYSRPDRVYYYNIYIYVLRTRTDIGFRDYWKRFSMARRCLFKGRKLGGRNQWPARVQSSNPILYNNIESCARALMIPLPFPRYNCRVMAVINNINMFYDNPFLKTCNNVASIMTLLLSATCTVYMARLRHVGILASVLRAGPRIRVSSLTVRISKHLYLQHI